MDLIVDLIDQLVQERVAQSKGDRYCDHAVEIAKIKERLRLVLLENLDR